MARGSVTTEKREYPSGPPKSFGPSTKAPFRPAELEVTEDATKGAASTSTAANAETARPLTPSDLHKERSNLLGKGEMPFSGEEMLLRPAGLPGLHVQLFRRLQAKWQCYDAYCRVCMALGVNQILQGLSYYSIVHTLVENRSPSCGYALLIIFQCASFALAVLDISGVRRRYLLGVQAVGTLPAFLAANAVHSAERTPQGALEPGEMYWTSPGMFLLQSIWLELLLRISRPSDDDAALPRNFRTVLFLDVFGDGTDPTEYETQTPEECAQNKSIGPRWSSAAEEHLAAERFASAQGSMLIAQAAVRRWEAAPSQVLSSSQHNELQRLRVELQIWRRALGGEIAWRAASHGLAYDELFDNVETRGWGELSTEEKVDDPFRGFLIGPFEHDMGYDVTFYHYDIENIRYLWESPGPIPTLSLTAVAAAVRAVEASVRLLLAMSEEARERELRHLEHHREAETQGAGTVSDPALQPLNEGLVQWSKRTFHSVRSRMSGVCEVDSGIELSQPLVNRQVSPGSNGAVDSFGPGFGYQPPSPSQYNKNLAGPHSKHFVPERLPWQVLRGTTRVLQFAWAFTGIMAVLRELGWYRIDFQQHPGKERRLEAEQPPAISATEGGVRCQSGPQFNDLPTKLIDASKRSEKDDRIWLRFESVQVQWPHRSFFQPEVLSWMPSVTRASSSTSTPNSSAAKQLPSGTGAGLLLIGSEFAHYRLTGMASSSPEPLVLEEFYPLQNMAVDGHGSTSSLPPPGAIAICGHVCFLGTPSQEEGLLTFWPLNQDGGQGLCPEPLKGVSLRLAPLRGGRAARPWRLLSGLVTQCDDFEFVREATRHRSTWCLLLAGWDGERLPIAMVPLIDGPCLMPAQGMTIRPLFSVPLGTSSHRRVNRRNADSGGGSVSGGVVGDGVGNTVGADGDIISLDVAAQAGKLDLSQKSIHLWGLFENGELWSWDLLQPKVLGRWNLDLPKSLGEDFQISSLCEDEDRRILLVAGWGATAGPQLLEAQSPQGGENYVQNSNRSELVAT
eukprot:TRINITY_DN26763_c0_g1_i1.p1 TRINITY_DN26763_c0_g1~~TRINITY_DN26763_c0_g1_i1.p1  ORF type:complete len:1057 (+),score=180.41 TRINITY_DN26763_c0_g1_i1:120-3173(+)